MQEQEGHRRSQSAAIRSISENVGCTGEAPRGSVRRADRDSGRRARLTTEAKKRHPAWQPANDYPEPGDSERSRRSPAALSTTGAILHPPETPSSHAR